MTRVGSRRGLWPWSTSLPPSSSRKLRGFASGRPTELHTHAHTSGPSPVSASFRAAVQEGLQTDRGLREQETSLGTGWVRYSPLSPKFLLRSLGLLVTPFLAHMFQMFPSDKSAELAGLLLLSCGSFLHRQLTQMFILRQERGRQENPWPSVGFYRHV